MEFFHIIDDLNHTLTSLKDQNDSLGTENGLLRQENTVLRDENARLKERLGLNSTNSSLPPSRDLYRIKRHHQTPSKRKRGAQPGHKAQGYQLQEPDEIVDIYPEVCACGHVLKMGSTFRRDQKIEIPPLKPYIKEYRLWQGVCSHCGQQKTASLPAGIQKDLLGDHAKSIIGALTGFYHVSKREAQQIIHHIFHLPLSLGLISRTEQRVSQALEGLQATLLEEVRHSPYVHIDETGHKSEGKRGWGWMLTTHEVSVLKLTSSRGMKVLSSLLPDYEGRVISDRYGAYNYFEESQRQICWSHLSRDFERFAHSQAPALAKEGRSLTVLSQEVFALNKAFKKQSIEASSFRGRMGKLKRQVKDHLKKIQQIPDIPHAHRVGNNLLKSFPMMWRFVDHPEVELTNNLAERQIRKYVVYRKKSLFTWSQRGNEFIERMFSLFLTCRLQQQNPFLKLTSAMDDPP